MSEWPTVRKPNKRGFPHMLVGCMRVSTDGDRQVMDLQHDALLAVGVDERHLFDDHASGRGPYRSRESPGVSPADDLPGGMEAGPPGPIAAASAGYRERTQATRDRISFIGLSRWTPPRRKASSCSMSSAPWLSLSVPWPRNESNQSWAP